MALPPFIVCVIRPQRKCILLHTGHSFTHNVQFQMTHRLTACGQVLVGSQLSDCVSFRDAFAKLANQALLARYLGTVCLMLAEMNPFKD